MSAIEDASAKVSADDDSLAAPAVDAAAPKGSPEAPAAKKRRREEPPEGENGAADAPPAEKKAATDGATEKTEAVAAPAPVPAFAAKEEGKESPTSSLAVPAFAGGFGDGSSLAVPAFTGGFGGASGGFGSFGGDAKPGGFGFGSFGGADTPAESSGFGGFGGFAASGGGFGGGAQATFAGGGFGEKPQEDASDAAEAEDEPPAGPIDVANGEEGERCLRKCRAKLFELEGGQAWKERGVCQLKVLASEGGVRVVMRREQTHALVLNAKVSAGDVAKHAEKALRVLSMTSATTSATYLIRVKTEEERDGLFKSLTTAV